MPTIGPADRGAPVPTNTGALTSTHMQMRVQRLACADKQVHATCPSANSGDREAHAHGASVYTHRHVLPRALPALGVGGNGTLVILAHL